MQLSQSVWGISALSEAIHIEPWTIRRAMAACVKAGTIADRRFVRHFRLLSSCDFPALADQLRKMGYENVRMPPAEITDSTSAPIERAAMRPPIRSREDELEQRVKKLEARDG